MEKISRAKALFSVYFIASLDSCGYAMVFVLFPSLLLEPRYGFLPHNPSLAQKLVAMGVLYASFPIAQLFGAPIIGELADRYGRKRIFFITIIGTILGYFLTGIVLTLKSITLLFICRFLTGLFSGNQGLCNASIADLSPNAKQRAKNFGILTFVWGISFPVSLLFGGIFSDPSLSKHFNPSLPFYLVGLLTLLSLVTLLFFYHETFVTTEKPLRLDIIKGFHNIAGALQMPDTRQFFLLLLLWTISWDFSVTWYGAYTIQKFGISQVTVTVGLLIQGIFWTLGGVVAKPILLRYLDVKPIALLAFGFTTLFLGITSFMPTFPLLILTYSLAAIGGAIALSSSFNMISLSASSKAQGMAMGIAQSMMSLGGVLAPALGGISGALSIYTYYPIATFFMLLGFGILYFSREKL